MAKTAKQENAVNVDLTQPVIPARYARSLLAIAEDRGLPRAPLMNVACIDEATLTTRGARLGTLPFSRLYGAIVLGLQDESCGLHSRAVLPGGIEMLCRVALTTSTLHDCLLVLARALPLVMGDFHAELRTAADQRARLTLTEKVPPDGDRTLAYELTLFTLCGVLAWLFGRRLPLTAVYLPLSKPRHTLALSILLGAPLHFDAEVASIEFTAQTLTLPVVRTADDIAQLMRRAPASLVEVLLEQARLPSRLLALLQQNPTQPLSLEHAAAQLAMSPRTLHRKLAALGESFQGIKDGWRFRQAAHWLSCTDVPVKQIAADLGFSDQATFRRAFSHWAGHPPGALRNARKTHD